MTFFSTAQAALLRDSEVTIAQLAELEFTTSTTRLWDGNTDLVTLDAKTWAPTFGAGAVEGSGDLGNGESSAVKISLYLNPDSRVDIMALALSETSETEGQLDKVYMQLFGSDLQPVGNPVLRFVGHMQPLEVQESSSDDLNSGVITVSVAAENIFVKRSIARYGMLTDASQKARSSDDRIAEGIPLLANANFTYPDF